MSINGDFVIRVYGIIINHNKEVLISDEFQLGMKMTKFPGGGLEYGEGTIECLKREFREECNGQEIKNINHFYTTDYFQEALFIENKQLLSIYYLAELLDPLKFKISERPFDFQEEQNETQSFRWVKIKSINQDEITFPIDKFVADKIKKQFL
jgi:ADP-ribose pyrophosphatase YjhB (NUDIX family)